MGTPHRFFDFMVFMNKKRPEFSMSPNDKTPEKSRKPVDYSHAL